MRILVADDDAALRDLLVEILVDEGHQAVEVSTPLEALSLGCAEEWDLFLIDTLGQADHGPTEECKALVQELAARAPVILCTGRLWARRTEASELGAVAILEKPFDLDELIERVAAVGSRTEASTSS